jgi:hypothetical protein
VTEFDADLNAYLIKNSIYSGSHVLVDIEYKGNFDIEAVFVGDLILKKF